MTDDVRPRRGMWYPAGADQVPLVFEPDPRDPTTYVGVRADTKGPIAYAPGDSFEVDVLGPGQSIRLRTVLRAG